MLVVAASGRFAIRELQAHQLGVDRDNTGQLFCNVTLVCFREVSR